MEKYVLSKWGLQVLGVGYRSQLKVSGEAADRAKAVYLLGNGWSMRSVFEALIVDPNTARNYFIADRAGGASCLLATHYEGSEEKINEKYTQSV